MKINYFVYSRSGESFPILSTIKLPPSLTRGKQKYIGKKAKIETVLRLSNVSLLSALTTQQVNDYIAENYFNKPLWKDYYKIFQIVANEFEIVSEKYMMKYVLVVELENSIEDPNDERLIHMLTCELLGQKLTQYNGLNNPVVSFIKNHKNAN
jgi:myosin-crossreactive antigen